MTVACRLLACAVAASLGACSSATSMLEGNKVDYKSAGQLPTLEIPPDLTTPARDNRYVVPETGKGAATLSGYEADRAQQAKTGNITAGVLPTIEKMRIERSGNQRWLVIAEPPEKLWPLVRDFWQENGFLIAINIPEAGVMETDWAENRAKIPQDGLRGLLGKFLDQIYSTAERDKFRTRLERSEENGTEIYISHRGMIEVYGNTQQKDQTIWQPRAVDPELETEFLRRLMMRLGAAPETAKAVVVENVKATSKVTTVNGQPVIQIDEGFERAWRRVGLSLDRTGFTVEDRDRAKGTYFVRYVAPSATKTEPGFFAKLFGSTPTTAPLKYRVTVQSQSEASTVSLLNAEGGVETSANAQAILKIIADDLR